MHPASVVRPQERMCACVSLDFHEVGVGLLIAASMLNLLLLIFKGLGKEFEETAVVWIRAFKRIRAEWNAPLTIEKPAQPTQLLNQN